jgi:hypothetical protein
MSEHDPNETLREFREYFARGYESQKMIAARVGVSEPVNGSDQTAHHHISALDRTPKSRLDGFAFSFEVAITGTFATPV